MHYLMYLMPALTQPAPFTPSNKILVVFKFTSEKIDVVTS